ncbi:MAG: M15 family metallopeptidase [Lactobacillaceae bacterium]|jgi:D-alanyl-D-alanine carboxypeptidase|nr:M15 family metallopeptidase [Lactobacillaceae bacterium]
MKSKKKLSIMIIFVGIVALVIFGIFNFVKPTPKISGKNVKAQNSSRKNVISLPEKSDSEEWNLILVNAKNVLSKDPDFQKVAVDQPYGDSGNIYVDQRIQKALRKFRTAAENAGYPTIFISGYRSYDTQKSLYEAAGGSSQNPVLTQRPGASEHETGLAFDLVGQQIWNQVGALQPTQLEAGKDQQWLIINAPKFGFILRYPKGKEAIKQTGIDYESWHFRYVGVKNAEYIMNNNLTLEEYISLLKKAGR